VVLFTGFTVLNKTALALTSPPQIKINKMNKKKSLAMYLKRVDRGGETGGGEEGSEVGRVVCHDDAAEKPEPRHQHPARQRPGSAFRTYSKSQIIINKQQYVLTIH
jgi:hypothetical protein